MYHDSYPLKTTDMLEEVNSEAMVDSGTTGNFIDENSSRSLSCQRVTWLCLPSVQCRWIAQ